MTSVGPFELLDRLASGGMASVWRARHRRSGVLVAMKVLSIGADEALDELLDREICRVALLDHPHVVRILDAGRLGPAPGEGLVPGSPWLAMELAAGTLPRKGHPWPRARAVLLAVLDALAHAHAHGVLHRDLKPANVLLDRDGRPKVSDFGIGLTQGDRDAATTSSVGTPPYMAPEQFGGATFTQGPWTDLYALGCLGWSLVTGHPPFRRRGVAAYQLAHLEARPAPLDPIGPVPAGLEGWLRQLLEKDPRDRPASAAEAAAALLALPAPPEAAGGTVEVEDGPHPTWDTPASELPTLLLPAGAVPGLAPAPGRAVRLPDDWRDRRVVPRDLPLVDAGLGLLALRPPPLVGRLPERDACWAALRDASDRGCVRVVAIGGPSGIGRTALAEWTAARAAELGADRFAARFAPEAPAELGLLGGLRDLLRAHGADTATLRPLLGDAPEADALARLLGSEEQAGAGRSAALVAGALAHRASRGRTLVVVLDDAQWGVEGLMLAHALLDGAPAPVLVLLAVADDVLFTRPHEQAELAALQARPSVDRIALGPLSIRERRELVDAILPLEASLAARLDARSVGSPRLLVELLREVVARGLVEPGPDGFRLASGADLPASIGAHPGVPRLVEEHPEWRLALVVAAALGTRVDLREWRAACARLGTAPRRGLVDALLRAGLAGTSEGPGHLVFSSVHVREAALSGVEQAVLARVHAACAEVLPQKPRHRVARHRAEAGLTDPETLEALLKGVQELRSAGDYSGALAMLHAAGARTADLPGKRFDVQLYEADLFRLMGQHERAVASAREALALAGEDQAAAAQARSNLAILLLDAADPRAYAEMEAAVAVARGRAKPDWFGLQLVRLAIVRGWAGDDEGSERAAREAVEVLDAKPGAWAGPAAYMVLAQALAKRAPADAEAWLDRAEEGFARQTRPLSIADCRIVRASMRFSAGRLDEAEVLLEEVVRTLREAAAAVVCGPLGLLGEVLRRKGRLGAARAALEEAIRLSERGSRIAEGLSCRLALVHVEWTAQDHPRAARLLADWLARIRGRRGPPDLVERVRDLRADLGEHPLARELLAVEREQRRRLVG